MTDVKNTKRIKSALQPDDWIVGQEEGAGLGDEFRFQIKSLNADLRAAAPWYATDQANKIIIWSGDSTTDQMAGGGLINFDGSWNAMYPIAENIPQTVKQYNYGNNGTTLKGFVTDTLPVNAGGLNTNITYIASLKADVYILGWMINDARQAGTGYVDGNIAGAAYGNAAQIAFAIKMRQYLDIAVTKIRTANPNAIIIFRMPNAHVSGSSFIVGAGGLTAQNMMDSYKLVYRGDVALGFPALTDLYTNAIMIDELRLLYGDTMPVTSHPMIDPDKFHPAASAYFPIVSKCLESLNQEPVNSISSAAMANTFKYKELVSTHSGLLPGTLAECTDSGMFDEQVKGKIQAGNGSSYVDFSFTSAFVSGTLHANAAFGAATGGASYGAVSDPSLAIGDIGVILKSDGTHIIFSLSRAPDSNGGAYCRWFNGAPDGSGAYPSASLVGSPVRWFRHKYACSEAAKTVIERKALNGFKGTTYANYYRAMVKAKGANSLTLQGIGYSNGGNFSAHVLSVTDVLCLLGVDDGVNGLLLTGATFSNNAGGLGDKTITLANPNLATAGWKQAIILSNT